MIPSSKEWKNWNAKERASYISQIATTGAFVLSAAAFLGSTIFSYLSYREAAATRQDQRNFFISEKAPVLYIANPTVFTFKQYGSKILLTVDFRLKNKGASPAMNVQATVPGDATDYPYSRLTLSCNTAFLDNNDERQCLYDLYVDKDNLQNYDIDKVEFNSNSKDYIHKTILPMNIECNDIFSTKIAWYNSIDVSFHGKEKSEYRK